MYEFGVGVGLYYRQLMTLGIVSRSGVGMMVLAWSRVCRGGWVRQSVGVP